MASRDDLFIVEGLIAPEPSPTLANLFARLSPLGRHPGAKELGHTYQRQIWELHRVLYRQPDVIIELLTEFYGEAGDCIPLPYEVRPLARACWCMWSAMAGLGLQVDREIEPELPMPARRRARRTVFPPDDD